MYLKCFIAELCHNLVFCMCLLIMCTHSNNNALAFKCAQLTPVLSVPASLFSPDAAHLYRSHAEQGAPVHYGERGRERARPDSRLPEGCPLRPLSAAELRIGSGVVRLTVKTKYVQVP